MLSLILFATLQGPAYATDVDARTGVDRDNKTLAVPSQTETAESHTPSATCHPERFPHGPAGPAWVSVDKGVRAEWRRVVLTCRDDGRVVLRERRDFLPQSTVVFDGLPEGTACELGLRGGAKRADVALTTARVGGATVGLTEVANAAMAATRR